MAKQPKKKKTAEEKVTPDEDNPGFFNVEGASGYFSRETALRVARQLTPETTVADPGTHQAAEEEDTDE